MSSARLSEVLRSSTFRRALAAAGLVWLVCGAALVMVERLASWAVFHPLSERANGEIDEILTEIAEGHHSLEDDELDLDWDFEKDELIDEYAAAIRRLLADEELDVDERRGLRARLAILGETDLRGLGDAPLPAYEDLMFEEVPEHFHDALDEAIEEHRDLWEDFVGSPDQLTGDDVAAALEELEMLEDEDVCLELRSEAGEILASHLESRRCFSTEVRLADGAVLRYGFPSTAHEMLRRMRWIRNAGLLLGLAIVLASSYLRARRTVRLLDDLARTGRRLEDGEFDARIRRPGDGGDFDRAVAHINTMLDRVEDSMTTVSQVTDNIAHDLRTPLTRLQGQLDLLKRHPERSDAMIEAVQDEADQLLATFNALMQIARVRSGRQRLSFRTFDMARVVTDVGELYAPAFAEEGLGFECAVPPSEVRAVGDSDLWMQAFSNLLDNALKYTGEGRVRLDLRPAGGAFVVELRDSGPGIPETEVANVFQRFYRLPQHRRQRGNGLGLTLVAAICDLHGAEIELLSDGGLLVRIRIPSM